MALAYNERDGSIFLSGICPTFRNAMMGSYLNTGTYPPKRLLATPLLSPYNAHLPLTGVSSHDVPEAAVSAIEVCSEQRARSLHVALLPHPRVLRAQGASSRRRWSDTVYISSYDQQHVVVV